MRFIWRWIKRVLVIVVLLVLGLLAPVAYIEVSCRGTQIDSNYTSLLPVEHHRSESRTLLTYPEWHIVHAYDDYAEVIRTGDPHEFDFLRSITGFWSSLCSLSETSASHGGFDAGTRQMVYVIGVSFTAEFALKAAYEETVGRLFATIRGENRAALDDLSAIQARSYATFLQQVPWYRWDFAADADALQAAVTSDLRDRERAFALGVENRTKATYAEVIAAAVANVGFDALTLRMIVTDVDASRLEALPGVSIIAEHAEGLEVETPRYRELTGLLADMAAMGAGFVEIAGNDDIMLTVLSDSPAAGGALYSFPRQGYGDYRHLLMVPVTVLDETLRDLAQNGLRLEHIHDY